MAARLIGYARCSTDQQGLTAQSDGLLAMGVDPARIYVDHGLTGTNRDRPGLREVLAACREGDTLVLTKLDRLARSLPDACAIAGGLTARQVRLNLGVSVYDPNDADGRLLFNELNMVAAKPLAERELRQNASKVVSDVEQRGSVVVTVNGRDAVVMTPLSRQHRWVPTKEALCF